MFAMGVSACSVAVLLAVLGPLVDIAVIASKPGVEHEERLIVHIRNNEHEPKGSFTTGEQDDRSSPQDDVVSAEVAERQQSVEYGDVPEPVADSPPVKDWSAIADEAAKTSVNELVRQEEFRASMWRQSRSTMFQPTNEFVVKEEEPVISNFRFIPRIHVAGLGVTIGSCFIGIPLVGVPVEQRTVAISLFVCARGSG